MTASTYPTPARARRAAGGPRLVRRHIPWARGVVRAFAFLSAAGWVWADRPGDDPQRMARDPDVEDLGRRLIRETAGDKDNDIMQTILRLMDESSLRLEVRFQAGAETQVLQQKIVRKLDIAIREAARRRRKQSQPNRSRSSDRRRMPTEPESDRSARDGTTKKGDETIATASRNGQTPSGQADSKRAGGALRETRRAWGHLPERERDEIIQGVEDAYLQQYRRWIEQYYRALQEAEP